MKSSTIRILAIAGALVSFGVGAITWRVVHTGRSLSELSSPEDANIGPRNQGTLVEVAGAAISAEDLEWEFTLHTRGIFGAEDLTPIPDLGNRLEKELSPLKQKLMAGMIERKMLFAMLRQDKKFASSDPARFTRCLEEWQKLVSNDPKLYGSSSDQSRLKDRLCERSLIDQYLKEVVFLRVAVNDPEITEYYKNHINEFKKPQRVKIRHILAATEKAAKEAKARVNRGNFSEIAKELSVAPESASGGLLGPFAQGDFPNHFNIAFEMQPGQISEILKSTYGFHIIMLIEKMPRSTESLEEATPTIRKLLAKKKQEEEYKKWVEAALHTIPITTPKPLW